jgi:sn-glycerol 3-phosphate transport system permease protein
MIARKKSVQTYLADITMVAISVIWLVPLVFTVLVSFRPEQDPITAGNIFFGSRITLENYQATWAVAPWSQHYINSLIFVFGTLIVQVVTVTMAAYAFARMKFFGRDALLLIILVQLMIPTGVLIVQNFATVRYFNLVDTHWALMVPYWGSAFGTLLLRQAFREIPYELEEAARIDGASWLALMRYVYVPLSAPTYIAFALVSISGHWNEFLWPFIVTRSEEVRPLTVGLNKLLKTTEVGALYGQLMAGTLIVIAPLVILFLLFQRRFIESFASSGIK